MVDSKDVLQLLRQLGVKSAKFSTSPGSFYFTSEAGSVSISEVEFFPTIAPFDLDTLVPPAPDSDGETETVKVPPAFARVLGKGSVS